MLFLESDTATSTSRAAFTLLLFSILLPKGRVCCADYAKCVRLPNRPLGVRHAPMDGAVLRYYIVVDLQHLQHPRAAHPAKCAPAGCAPFLDYSAGAFDSPRSFSETLSRLIR